ncbi:MAG: 1-deoxy-D-xylulose-5-phosphate reductoisomerase [Ignavibacteriae bacterium]|nr:1-deoxy-D-xylulose-5-phosphate reductoisomerase [Ignavibacteriota bacterium]
MRKIGVLGSTGSIGCNTLEVVRSLYNNGLPVSVSLLSTNGNTELLRNQVTEFKPEAIFIGNGEKSAEFSNNCPVPGTRLLRTKQDLLEYLSVSDFDTLVNAIVGFAGLIPTIESIKSGKNIALANKETLVVAGKLVNELVNEYNVSLLPIDSEHSAILQCLAGEDKSQINKLILTASGGPFRGWKYSELKNVTVEQALQHPNWNMGDKITIDSATLMNKGLEVIEANSLFNIDVNRIHVVMHPQSIIHSFVEFSDGSVKAQMGLPDMKIPIQYAITYPSRISSSYDRMDFTNLQDLTFEKPDLDTFKCLAIAYEVLKKGGTYPVVLNSANEIAVKLFLDGRIGFTQIADLIEKELESHKSCDNYKIEDLIFIDEDVRNRMTANYYH